MTDTLMYRFPGKAITVLNGAFREVVDWHGHEGFVLSTFRKDKLYVFEQGLETEPTLEIEAASPCLTEYEYLEAAEAFRKQIEIQGLSKAVFSRIKEIPFDKNPTQLFFRLVDLYPDAFVYFLSNPLIGTWLGASPEILLRTEGENASTMALAGTLPADDPGTWNRKELEEQEHVRNYIREKLLSEGIENVQEESRTEYLAGPVKHLVSHFSFDLPTSKQASLALNLHPTPAVSGFPQDKAVELIVKSETHDRSLYAGIIGVLGAEESDLYVNLRCARLQDESMFLYLGGGFTVDSEVEKEWQETENKALTLLNVVEDL